MSIHKDTSDFNSCQLARNGKLRTMVITYSLINQELFN